MGRLLVRTHVERDGRREAISTLAGLFEAKIMLAKFGAMYAGVTTDDRIVGSTIRFFLQFSDFAVVRALAGFDLIDEDDEFVLHVAGELSSSSSMRLETTFTSPSSGVMI